MKDKRTKREKNLDRKFKKCLAENQVVMCKHKVLVLPPSNDTPKNERVWTLLIDQQSKKHDLNVVIAWYKTRELARKHAKRLRTALTYVL